MMAWEITILTLNIWGIPYVSKDREVRVKAIGEELASGKYDIVSLQEVWSEADYVSIHESTKETFPFHYYFHR